LENNGNNVNVKNSKNGSSFAFITYKFLV
jgi:hypothetical protein